MDSNTKKIRRELDILLRCGNCKQSSSMLFAHVNENNKWFVRIPIEWTAQLLFTYDREYVRYIEELAPPYMDLLTEFATHVGATMKSYKRLRLDEDVKFACHYDLGEFRREVDDTELMKSCALTPKEPIEPLIRPVHDAFPSIGFQEWADEYDPTPDPRWILPDPRWIFSYSEEADE